MTPAPHCLCDSCRMMVEQCRGKQSEAREKVLELLKELEWAGNLTCKLSAELRQQTKER